MLHKVYCPCCGRKIMIPVSVTLTETVGKPYMLEAENATRNLPALQQGFCNPQLSFLGDLQCGAESLSPKTS